jgi:hypothetical protein
MKRLMLTVALICVFSVSALAGEMPTFGVVASTPDPVVASTTDPGEMPTTGTPSPAPGETQGPSLLATVILAIITWSR